ncbi:SCO2583 family membrane protein [Streptomyces sp. GSL17-111]|uniref:SCO2583 family membrane protein n=1 Tax=Streptomyces sp. GSL17-111 TaxID=3121596 RepID=UPI0030F39D2E
MAGRADSPDGIPGGSDDEFRSTVFDESFVRQARLQEYSAQERLDDPEHREHPVRRQPSGVMRLGGSSVKQGIVLLTLVVLAFATAVYMGMSGAYQREPVGEAPPLRASVVPLSPRGPVPGGTPERLFATGPAADFRVGAAGVTRPEPTATRDFTETQVGAALELAKNYVVASAVDSRVLRGSSLTPVRRFLVPDQRTDLDRSVREAATTGTTTQSAGGPDGVPPVTGWLVRFDTQKVTLSDAGVRVRGSLTVTQRDPNALEVTADHVFVYAVRAAGQADEERSSLVTVRRQVRMVMQRADLLDQRLRLEHVVMQAGPLACGTPNTDMLRPLAAGESADGEEVTGTDPFADRPLGSPVCGVLADAAQPDPSRR